MAFLTWLPDVLRKAGCDVYVMPGAETRSTWRSGLTPLGVVWHHTATGPNWQDGHVAALLRDGRRDLRGPLSQVGIERDGTWVIVALGRANHNGYGQWGNDSIGLEFYNDGRGEPWPDVQVRSGVIGTAAILGHMNKSAHLCLAHRETDPRRKIDPHGLSMSGIRKRVDAVIRFNSTSEEDAMLTTDIVAYVDLCYTVANNPHQAGRLHWVDRIDAQLQDGNEKGARDIIRHLKQSLGI